MSQQQGPVFIEEPCGCRVDHGIPYRCAKHELAAARVGAPAGGIDALVTMPREVLVGLAGDDPAKQELLAAWDRENELRRNNEADLADARHARDEAEQQIATLKVKLKERQADLDYHSECRPNRRQAEAAMADAKAMNDKWADEVKARREAEDALAALRAQLRALQDEMFEEAQDFERDDKTRRMFQRFGEKLAALLAAGPQGEKNGNDHRD